MERPPLKLDVIGQLAQQDSKTYHAGLSFVSTGLYSTPLCSDWTCYAIFIEGKRAGEVYTGPLNQNIVQKPLKRSIVERILEFRR